MASQPARSRSRSRDDSDADPPRRDPEREQLERDLQEAVDAENFEEAARLRDKIKTLWPGPQRLFRPKR